MYLIVSISCALSALALLYWALRATSSTTEEAPEQSGSSTARHRLTSVGGEWLGVGSADDIVEACALSTAIRTIARESGLAPAVFERDIKPAICRYLEFIQLAPASEAHHHAHAGGLAAHTMETLVTATTMRRGHLLPSGGAAEAIDAQRDHWTYAVIFAALLHDVGKVVADLRITYKEPGSQQEIQWHPMAGSLIDAGARCYRIGFAPKSERDYGAHRKLPVVLLQRLVPTGALAFLGRHPPVLQELTQYLSDEECANCSLGRIVRQADQLSAAKNLENGPRVRFPSATAKPLVERMQTALKALIADGELPLNRDGAAGWAVDGAVFFVAKRVADAVRERIIRDEGATDGVPTKNDRLFDTWQDYRIIDLNPVSEQAIWYMRITCDDYSHQFAMLRFPMHQLWSSQEHYPTPFNGSVLPKSAEEVSEKVAIEAPDEEAQEAQTADSTAGPKQSAAKIRRTKSNTVREPKPAPERASKKRGGESGETQQEASSVSDLRAAPSRDDAQRVSAKQSDESPDESYLDEDDSASNAARAEAVTTGAAPVTPHVGVKPDIEPDALAIRFIEWVQQGLASGALTYNEPGAMVHIVEQGMALVSPRIFKVFADEQGEGSAAAGDRANKPGARTQRSVIKAAWHVVTAGQNNIQHFTVIKRGGVSAGKLAAVVLKHPERWLNPLPPVNPNLKPFELTE